MINFGKRVKELRKAQKITKEEFCGDESELSVRQLTRIESGVSTPTLAKVIFIAQRLGVKVGELADEDRFHLPERYKELKFLLLRTQTYLDKDRIAKRSTYLEEIFDNYYDHLPEEEQLIIEILQSILDIINHINDFSAKKILEDYWEQIKHKNQYTVNDLILVDLYSMYISYKFYPPKIYDKRTYQHIIDTLLTTDQCLKSDEIFILNKALSSAASNCVVLKNKNSLKQLLAKLESLMLQTQDFQRMPTLNLLKWKFYLSEDNLELAKKHYLDACTFSKLTNDIHLTAKLEDEWQRDLSKLS